ncbi:hypothetical protein [Lacinutrix salivirga]
MKLKYLLILILILILGCVKDKNKQIEAIKAELTEIDKIYLNKIIDSIYELDQNPRLYIDQIDSIYGLETNSWMISKYRNTTILDSIDYKSYRKSIDSLWLKINEIDNSNTDLLINLTKKYGFPNNKRTGVYKSKAYFIFVHSPKESFAEIEELISEEYNAGRISEYKKEYIFWHTKGRQGMPPRSSENGEAIWLD